MKIEITSISLPDEPHCVYELAYPQGFTDEEGNDLSEVTFQKWVLIQIASIRLFLTRLTPFRSLST